MSDGSFCVAAADVRAVQRVYGAVTEMSNKIYKEILKEILLSKKQIGESQLMSFQQKP